MPCSTTLDLDGFWELLHRLAAYMDSEVNLGGHQGSHYCSEEQLRKLGVTKNLLLILTTAIQNEPNLLVQLGAKRESLYSGLKESLHGLIKWYMLNPKESSKCSPATCLLADLADLLQEFFSSIRPLEALCQVALEALVGVYRSVEGSLIDLAEKQQLALYMAY